MEVSTTGGDWTQGHTAYWAEPLKSCGGTGISDTVTGRSRYIVRQHRDVTEVWGGSLMEWLKEAGYGIYVHGARVETGSNEPIHDGMMRLEQPVRHFLKTYNIQVWGDQVRFDTENKPRWMTPSEVPEKLRDIIIRKIHQKTDYIYVQANIGVLKHVELTAGPSWKSWEQMQTGHILFTADTGRH